MQSWISALLNPSSARIDSSNPFPNAPGNTLSARALDSPCDSALPPAPDEFPEPLTIFAVADPDYDSHPNRRRQAPRPARPRRRKNTKLTGELGEAAFLHAAITRGLPVARPWGDSRRYDFLVQSSPTSNRFHRIQVKCTESINALGYQVQATYCDRKRKGKYTAHDIDFLVAYIIPLNLVYLVPISAVPESASLRFYPKGSQRKQAKFERFREAWRLLGPSPQP